jgi:hypothetical protein
MLFGAMQQDPLQYFTDMSEQYGDVWGMRIGNFRSFFVNHPDLIEDVLVNKARLYHKGRILQANKYLFGEGLLTAEGISGCGSGGWRSRPFTASESPRTPRRWPITPSRCWQSGAAGKSATSTKR